MRTTRLALVVALALPAAAAATPAAPPVYRVDRVIDGDTIELTNGQHVRLVQIDTPEVYGGYECYGPQASAAAKRLLPEGTRVRLLYEPASDPVDQYGRLLRYVLRVSDGMNINLRLVTVGAAAPWFYDGERGRYLATLQRETGEGEASRALWSLACELTCELAASPLGDHWIGAAESGARRVRRRSNCRRTPAQGYCRHVPPSRAWPAGN
jgi:endonuclease YncB( thermonuclease family)